ncbi:MAG TPA: ABC transporter ATP-binding protein [Candidatus Limnocylindrales bacterium]|nr:ABC transporter ATP-binding protein [Candidatus Limnocylindrales bacterium]
MADLLRIENLETHFRTREGVVRAVDGVSFSIREGETMALVGESGCGKSVTALSIMRLIDYPGEIAGGRILFQGKDLAELEMDEMRHIRGSEIAMIFQEPMTSLNPVYTVGDQIAEAVELHMRVSKKEAWNRAIEMLDLVRIPSPERRVKDYPHNMSGGMRQRVMIAMALSCNPKLLIADEPTTALDVTIQAQILDLMLELQTSLKMSILLITHDLGVVAETCKHVAVMYAGQIVEQAEVETLFHSPQMPYTEGLLKSIPRLGMTQAEKLAVIRGVVPNPLRWPAGCRFMPRCDYAFEKCTTPPPLFELGGQKAACWLCESGRRSVSTAAPTAGQAFSSQASDPQPTESTAEA